MVWSHLRQEPVLLTNPRSATRVIGRHSELILPKPEEEASLFLTLPLRPQCGVVLQAFSETPGASGWVETSEDQGSPCIRVEMGFFQEAARKWSGLRRDANFAPGLGVSAGLYRI